MSLVKFKNGTRSTVPYFNNVLDTLFSDALNNNYGVNKMPAVNISELADGYRIELAAPGLNKEDFKIELKKDTLLISAECKVESVTSDKGYSRKEFEYSTFSRSFVLPEVVDVEKITAEYINGILNITIGKKEKEKDTHKEIVVS
jgi:HSP20 family protein